MTGNQFKVSQEDLQLLSAMLDGEVSDQELDYVLDRIAKEPALGDAWTRLSQIQAATHFQTQTSLNVDLSSKIADRIAHEEFESTQTPVIPFPERKPKTEDQLSHVDLSEQLKARLVTGQFSDIEKKQSGATQAMAQIIERKNPAKTNKFSLKGFKKQILAHIAVAASVASITVWVQNDLMLTTSPQLVQAEVQQNTNATDGAMPSVLVDEQILPVATVGNGPSSMRVETPVGDLNSDNFEDGKVKLIMDAYTAPAR